MANWEYKILSSGKHGMATMAALEQHLNDLGQQQWEIVNWQTDPDNPLKFTGLARRPILRDWAPEEMPSAHKDDAARAAAEAEEREKERLAWMETLARERELYAKVIEAEGDTGAEDDDENEPRDLTGELLDKLRPLMKRNQRGPGASGSISFLARRLDESEDDLIGALAEAGLALDDDATDSEPVEVGGDVFWLNRNSRQELWINSCPKSRYRPPAPKRERAAPAPAEDRAPEGTEDAAPAESAPAPAASGAPLPEGPELLAKLRPMMRRNRRGRGWSGSVTFLARALRQSEADLQAALERAGLALPAAEGEQPAFVEADGCLHWLNRNEKGQVWINAREERAGEEEPAEETASAEPAATEPAAPAAAPAGPLSAETVLAAIRPHFTKNKRGNSWSAAPAAVAEALGVAQADLIDLLVRAGMRVPETEQDKPVFAEHGGEIFWFNRNARDELWLNAKSKPARRGRGRRGADEGDERAEAVEEPQAAGEEAPPSAVEEAPTAVAEPPPAPAEPPPAEPEKAPGPA